MKSYCNLGILLIRFASLLMLRPIPLIPLMVVALTAVAVGCNSAPKASKNSGTLSGTDEQIFIGDTVEKNYDPNVIIKRAESFFDKEEYPEAVIEFQHFLELHRVHTLAPYAQYKLAESYYKQIRTVDRDPDPVHKALDAYQKLRREWPATRWDGDAQERIRSCHNMVAQGYLLVGQFYYRREAYLAAAHRFEAILIKYPDLDVAADALYHLALAYNEMGAEDWARERLIAFTTQYPDHNEAGAGRRLLASLNSKREETTVASAAPEHGPSTLSYTGPDGTIPSVTSASLDPVTSLKSPRTANASHTGLLCRLGLWC